jgi:hypothetical protein
MAKSVKKKPIIKVKQKGSEKKSATMRAKVARGEFVSNLPRAADGTLLSGPGRRKGTPNRLQQGGKENISDAFFQLGGVPKMVAWAKSTPERLDMFYNNIYLRILPLQVQAETTNDRYRDVASEREALGRLLLGAISARDKSEPERVPLVINADPVRDTEPRLVLPVERASKAA